MTDKEITELIGNAEWTRNSDGLIDVAGSVYLSNKCLKELPLRFGKVTGDFCCHYNQLASLAGLPGAKRYLIDSDQRGWLTEKPVDEEWRLRRV